MTWPLKLSLLQCKCTFQFLLQLCTRRARKHCMGLPDLHNPALAKTTHAFPCGAGASRRLAHKTPTRTEGRRGHRQHTNPTDPCTQAGGAALPMKVARILCLPYHSGRRGGEHGSGANMPLLLSSMTLPIPSKDSPDNILASCQITLFRKRKLLVRQK